jgi:hypothetical protein
MRLIYYCFYFRFGSSAHTVPLGGAVTEGLAILAAAFRLGVFIRHLPLVCSMPVLGQAAGLARLLSWARPWSRVPGTGLAEGQARAGMPTTGGARKLAPNAWLTGTVAAASRPKMAPRDPRNPAPANQPLASQQQSPGQTARKKQGRRNPPPNSAASVLMDEANGGRR